MPNLNQRLPCAYAATLHYGTHTVQLAPLKQTSPALAINFGGATYFGALFDDAAPTDTLRIQVGATTYWLGEYCAPGTYTPPGTQTCLACGMGHFCTGGHHRAPCTYGAISCPGINHATDAALPAGAVVNVFMTSDDVNTYIPPTDITQWAKISCCSTYAPGGTLADSNIPDSLNNKNTACADGIIGPGTYLFVARYPTTQFDTSDCMTATPGLSNAFVAVFDHAVGHRIIHGNNVFQHFVDVNNAPYQSWTISTAPVGHWLQNTNQTNVSNIPAQATGLTMCVFELK